MRAVRDADGSFRLTDGPLRVEDAERMLASMEELGRSPPSPDRERLLAECGEAWRRWRTVSRT